MLSVSHCLRLLPLLLSLLFAGSGFSSDSSPAWRDALTAYKAGDFEKASAAFLKIAEDEKQVSAALCHNLANSEYKRGEEVSASIWYRRALALDPWLPEARQNYRFLVRTQGFHEFKQEGLTAFAGRLPRRYWLAACQTAVWVALLSVVWLVWATPRRGRRWPLVTVLSLAVLALGTALAGLIGKAGDPAPFARRQISTPKDALARTAPAEAAGSVISLPPGSEVLPVKVEGYWTYCDLPGGAYGAPLRGWVRSSTLQPLWPWEASLVE